MLKLASSPALQTHCRGQSDVRTNTGPGTLLGAVGDKPKCGSHPRVHRQMKGQQGAVCPWDEIMVSHKEEAVAQWRQRTGEGSLWGAVAVLASGRGSPPSLTTQSVYHSSLSIRDFKW
jgi:hypothetical protein